MAHATGAQTTTYTISRLRTFRGMEGTGFNVSLMSGGREAAFVINEGNGGMFRWEFKTRRDEEAVRAHVEAERAKIPADRMFHGTPERKLFCMDIWIESLVEDAQFLRKMQRDCRTKTVFQVGDKIGGDDFMVIRESYSADLRRHIERQFPGQRLRIVNEEFLDRQATA